MRRLGIVLSLLVFVGCQKSKEDHQTSQTVRTDLGSGSGPGSGSAKTRPKAQQVQPPMDLKNPPADAVKTASGLIYKKLVTNDAGAAAKKNDTVLINYTGWRQNSGETFFTNKGRGQPMPLNLATTAPGFTEALQLVKKGEKAVLWVPPSIGYKGAPQPNAETLVYEVEVVDIQPAPAIPPDVAGAPATAKTLKSVKYIELKAGTGKDKPRYFDTVTYNYSAWTADGKMFDSTEMRKRPAAVPPFRQSKPMEDVLTTMVVGQRLRFWVDAKDMMHQGKPLPGQPTGMVCYEIEITEIQKATKEPPPVPANVAKQPDNAKKTDKGVFYVVLKQGKGNPKPKATESVKVNYTGWTTDGRMFDSSVVKGQPAEFSLGGVIPGWTDGIQQMGIGDTVRFWIPVEMAYKGAVGRPQGMLVFDVELLEIKAAPTKPDSHGHGKQEGAMPIPPTPPDVAAPPADAKKTEKGVSYKVLKAGPGGPKPTAASKVKVHYSGWQTDGKNFDSSYKRGQPIEFSLGGVIAGWTDGLQVMSVGDTVRFWIPEELAYKGRDPKGMLVFDVELLEIKN